MKKQIQVQRMTETLKILRDDAIMALEGTWNKDDSGFQAQIDIIDEVLKLKKEL